MRTNPEGVFNPFAQHTNRQRAHPEKLFPSLLPDGTSASRQIRQTVCAYANYTQVPEQRQGTRKKTLRHIKPGFCRTNVQTGVWEPEGMAEERVDSSLDLSHLTEEEQSSILQVLQRDLELRNLDEGRIRVAGELVPISSLSPVIGQEVGYNLDKSPVHHRATQRYKQPCTRNLTPKGNLGRVWEEARVPGKNPCMHTKNMLHPERPAIESKTFLLQGNSATNCTTVQPNLLFFVLIFDF
ncbi:hypothetical protein ILYODFUR_018334 [Ilyodon furcidens]|uniref:RabBD domain-containing protein n=1 Tax=Ilyodon furcidens TaxID=33524 RepID=A0ABV0TYI3_9TELE